MKRSPNKSQTDQCQLFRLASMKTFPLTLLAISLALSVATPSYGKDSLFSEAIHAVQSRPQSSPGTRTIDVGFSPNAGAEDVVLKAIDAARSTLRLAAYSFTSKPVIMALIAAKNRGVDVQCILDKSNTTNKSGQAAANLLVNAGIPTRIDSAHAIFHNKFIVVNDQHVETGSFNFSRNAAVANGENALLLWNVPELAAKYTANWNEHWSHSTDYRSNY